VIFAYYVLCYVGYAVLLGMPWSVVDCMYFSTVSHFFTVSHSPPYVTLHRKSCVRSEDCTYFSTVSAPFTFTISCE